MNDKSVLDKKYRFAHVLQNTEFATNFDPSKYNIIDNIQNHMTNGKSVKLSLDKLNIYSEGGHFKIHKDTPRGPDMIGSLIVCFPSSFTGGDLILHTESETVFNFSKLSETHYQWTAFYSDIDHEVKPVTSGNRITLTYGIYNIDNSLEKNLNESTVILIKNILQDPTFLPDGGTLGFGCKYLYSGIPEQIVLKGDDSTIYHSFAKLLLIPEIVHIIYNDRMLDDYIGCYCAICEDKNEPIIYHDFIDEVICEKCMKDMEEGLEKDKYELIIGEIRRAPDKHMYIENAQDKTDMVKQAGTKLPENIVWLNDYGRSWEELSLEADILYGNDPTSKEEIYKHCVFLITIPKYGNR
jgi:hypothetical protein